MLMFAYLGMQHHKNCPHHPPGNLPGQNLTTAGIVSDFKKNSKKIYSAIPEKNPERFSNCREKFYQNFR
jgi:hypothetical protein